MTSTSEEAGGPAGLPPALPPLPEHPYANTLLARIPMAICQIAFLVMIGVASLEIITRKLFSLSLYMSDEISGYMLVVLAFISLVACQLNGAFHRVDLVQERLSRRKQAFSNIVFDLLGIVFASVLLWQLIRFEIASIQSGNVAPTLLGTPLWLPQLAMPVGMALFVIGLLLTLVHHIRVFVALVAAER